MTNEQAIKWLKETLKETDFQYEQMEIAVEMAIKALEKVEKYEKAIEDIKKEIKEIQMQGYVDKNTCFVRDGQCVKNMVLEIIDKYIGGNK